MSYLSEKGSPDGKRTGGRDVKVSGVKCKNDDHFPRRKTIAWLGFGVFLFGGGGLGSSCPPVFGIRAKH